LDRRFNATESQFESYKEQNLLPQPRIFSREKAAGHKSDHTSHISKVKNVELISTPQYKDKFSFIQLGIKPLFVRLSIVTLYLTG
jgi:hypothetical protein